MSDRQCGFSMIEVLITLVIIATALLGTAGLQLYAMKMGKSGDFRAQAVFLANDLFERMESNELGAVAGNYVLAATPISAVTTAGTDCATNTCDAATLASWDLAQWQNAILAAGLPQASGEVELVTAGNPAEYTVTIGWVDRGNSASAVSETFSYRATRSVRSDG